MSTPTVPPSPAQTAGKPATATGSAPNSGNQPHKKSQFHARLENQKAQLERHGNFAEVVIRTTPEGTDMINFARLWEHVLVQSDRQTRGYVAKSSRNDFEATRKDFDDCLDFMVQKLKASISRHKLDMGGTNFISRVAQRYGITEKVRKGPSSGPESAPLADASAPAAEEAKARPARVSKAKARDDVDAD